MNITQALHESRARYEGGERETIDLSIRSLDLGGPRYSRRCVRNSTVRWSKPPHFPYLLTVDDLMAEDWEPVP